MKQDRKVACAVDIMNEFAKNTGLMGDCEPRRYLWTDAFAVCNFLELHERTGQEIYRTLALRLVDQVHQVLGRHRDDDARSGWISGLEKAEGSAHPTMGGLRIGKQLPERRPEEASDRQLEWEQDGQYFHYLTKWMHALHLVFLKTGEEVYDRWARELAQAAHAGFTYQPSHGGPKQLYWKMSIDLSHPLVFAMGHHDPLDAYVTYLELQSTAPAELAKEVLEMQDLCRDRDWTTDDPLGFGGLLCDGLWLARLMSGSSPVFQGLLVELLVAAAEGLDQYASRNPFHYPIGYRLAFRELGASIGLHAQARLKEYLRHIAVAPEQADILEQVQDKLSAHQKLGSRIEEFWLGEENQRTSGWISHRDINMVMLATSLVPDGFLGP
jgi:hypothetical protein